LLSRLSSDFTGASFFLGESSVFWVALAMFLSFAPGFALWQRETALAVRFELRLTKPASSPTPRNR
jgi:hypothetical protein